MRPTRLSMKGFGPFREHTEIEWNDIDLVALVGSTGSGKSTIIDAITFALYGNVVRYDDNRLVAPVINQTSAVAQVLLEFELGAQTYTAVRVVKRTKDGGGTTKEARLERGEEVIAADKASMTEAIELLLGLDVEQFNRTVVLPQGQFADFLHDKPKDRQDTLVQLLGVEMYRRIGSAARSRATREGDQVDALRAELADGAAAVTDDIRSKLARRIDELDRLRERFDAERRSISEADERLAALGTRIVDLTEQQLRLSEIEAPDDLEELGATAKLRRETLLDAERVLSDCRETQQEATEAATSGPDVTATQLGLKAYEDARSLSEQHEAKAAELAEATSARDVAVAAADARRAAQAALDEQVETARTAEEQARARRDAAASIHQIEAWSEAHSRHEEAAAAVQSAEVATVAEERRLAPLDAALSDAQKAALDASERLEAMRRRAGVLGHLDLLEVGEECPLCLQQVGELPAHDIDADVERAEDEERAASEAFAGTKAQRDESHAALLRARADFDAATTALARATSDIEGIPSTSALEDLRREAGERADAVAAAEEATRMAVAAAGAHHDSKEHAGVLDDERSAHDRQVEISTSAATLERRLGEARSQLENLAAEDKLREHLALAERLQTDLASANKALATAQTAASAAKSDVEATQQRLDEVAAMLDAARDRVATYEPPAILRNEIARSWALLTNWAAECLASVGVGLSKAEAEQSEIGDRRKGLIDELRSAIEQLVHDVEPDAALDELDRRLAAARATAGTELTQLDRRREELAALEARIEKMSDRSLVAAKLGQLLKANAFEGWLMEAALDELVERATSRLFELSGGQYSLEVRDRDFVVRDHTNADELRSARTLSGGETFLASLSLALALADATAELASGEVPPMESIFLDEGFGTLDTDTLDTVATAIEELGASGRMVGIVTHIRELADRMPVRLEVTKTGGASTVERVEV